MSIAATVQGFFLNNTVTPANNGTPIVGYQGTTVPEEYIVTIVSAKSAPGGQSGIVVRAILQEEVTIRTGSKWHSFIDVINSSQLGSLLNIGAQALTGTSLQSAVTSRRIWLGTDPLAMTLNLRFEEEYSSQTEVMEACEALHCMCLPGVDSGKLGLLIPPGPSPFMNDLTNIGNNGELIAVYVGNVLQFTNVIIKDVSVSFQVRMGTDGYFKAAKVSIQFETYEIITKNNLRTSGNNNGGIYSELGVASANKYNSNYSTMQAAAGFNPSKNINTATISQTVQQGWQSVKNFAGNALKG